MTSRVETLINPFHGVGQDLTPFKQAALALGRFYQRELELSGTGVEKLEIEISATKIPTITLTSLVFADGEWQKRAVRLIRQDREENVDVLRLCDAVLTTAAKVDEVVNGAVQQATTTLQRETPSIIEQILALKGRLKERERLNVQLLDELSQFGAVTQDALARAERTRRESDQHVQLLQRHHEEEVAELKQQLVASKDKTMEGLQNNLALIQQNLEIRNKDDRPIFIRSEDQSAAILNFVSLILHEENVKISDCKDLGARIATAGNTLKMVGVNPIKLESFLQRRNKEDFISDQKTHESFKKTVDLTNFRDVNRVLQRALQEHDVFIHDLILITGSEGSINPNGKYPCLALQLLALESRLIDIKNLYVALKKDKPKKLEEQDQEYIRNHIEKIEGRLKTLSDIKQSFFQFLRRCRVK